MSIEYNKFLSWAESRFGDVKVHGNEIMINSIFEEDYKHHLSCNPKGGKKNLPNGVFRCWKSGKTGSLVTLVRLVDKCSYEEAIETLGGETIIGELHEKIEKFFEQLHAEKAILHSDGLKFPEHTFPILSLPESHLWRVEAEVYLFCRKLLPDKFLVCIANTEPIDYKNRIVIPYFDKEGKLIYFNARFMGESAKVPKYLGPEKTLGVGKSDVIYMAKGNWPKTGEKIYLTEGEFDSESLAMCDLNAAAFGGKEIFDKQVEYIRDYIPVISIDTDKAGNSALLKIGDSLISKGFSTVRYIRPPNIYKDWNEMLVKTSPKIIKAYIAQNEKIYDATTALKLKINRL